MCACGRTYLKERVLTAGSIVKLLKTKSLGRAIFSGFLFLKHPHACGAKLITQCARSSFFETSPRMRGKLAV